jgi:hypothetical protein
MRIRALFVSGSCHQRQLTVAADCDNFGDPFRHHDAAVGMIICEQSAARAVSEQIARDLTALCCNY